MGCPTEVEIGDNLVFTVCTHDPDTGVLTDADAVPDYRIYEDETGTAILTGSMAKLDDANTVGFYSELIACTSGNGFENGKSYTIYIEATVDGDEGGISYGFKAVSAGGAHLTEVQLADASLTAAKIGADAITAAKIADDAISSEHLNTGALTADAFAADAIVAATLATGALTADAFAANAIVAATLAADCITEAKIADDAIATEHLATGAITADTIAANAIGASELADAAIDNATLSTDMDTHQAKVVLIDDDMGATDLYLVTYFKNGEPVTSGITNPKIQVVKASDGSDLIAEVALTEIGSLGMYKRAETTNRITDGDGYVAKITATIGGATRTWLQPVGRDD